MRNQFGSAAVGTEHAYINAVRIIDLEKAVGLFHEAAIQGWFLGEPWVLRAFNIFYGSFHFVVPAAVLVWLAARHPRDYPTWRNTILIGTGLALVGFSLFPLMPPRLLCDCAYGAGPAATADGLPHFVDTLASYGGLWSFSNSTMQSISNQYAAMPSLHFGWALWCALVLVPRVRHRSTKVIAAAYPVVTLLTIIVTGNHYWLDAVGGAAVIGLGWLHRLPPGRPDGEAPSWRGYREPGFAGADLTVRARRPFPRAGSVSLASDRQGTRCLMILESINSPADLRALDAEELEDLAEEIREFIVDAGRRRRRRPPRLQPRRRRAHPGPAPGVRLARRHHPVGHRPPGLRPQDASPAAPSEFDRAAPGRRPVRLPVAGPSPTHDWIENSHASTVLCYAHGLAVAQAEPRRARAARSSR